MHLDRARLDALWNFDDPAGTEARLLEEANTLPTESIAWKELQSQIARCLGLQQRFEEADTLLDSLESPEPQVQARITLERGRLRNSAGQPALAGPWFELAARFARESGDAYLEVDALHMLAIVDERQSANHTRAALEIAEQTTDPRVRRWRGPLHNNLGWTFHEKEKFEDALQEFQSALSVFQETGTPFQIHVAWWSVARCLRSLGRTQEALEIQQRLKAEDPPDEYVDEELSLLTET